MYININLARYGEERSDVTIQKQFAHKNPGTDRNVILTPGLLRKLSMTVDIG